MFIYNNCLIVYTKSEMHVHIYIIFYMSTLLSKK